MHKNSSAPSNSTACTVALFRYKTVGFKFENNSIYPRGNNRGNMIYFTCVCSTLKYKAHKERNPLGNIYNSFYVHMYIRTYL